MNQTKYMEKYILKNVITTNKPIIRRRVYASRINHFTLIILHENDAITFPRMKQLSNYGYFI